jgi:MoxR-like ATPase
VSLDELIPDVSSLTRQLADVGYLADPSLSTALFCAVRLPQPLLLEGEAGVGKTQAAKALAELLDTPLVRLQCFEGIDASEALYEWNYPRQLLGIRLAETRGEALEEESLFGPDYLISRPLLAALEHDGPRPAVLLIDEIDRADEEFEAFLFELLAESSVTIPEIGTLHAKQAPIVILTSNRTRDLHDALKRRCLYHWIDYPPLAQAVAIVRARVPEASVDLATEIASAVARLRSLDVQKPPGVAEAIDWVHAANLLGLDHLDEDGVELTLGSVLKYREDHEVARAATLRWIADPARALKQATDDVAGH